MTTTDPLIELTGALLGLLLTLLVFSYLLGDNPLYRLALAIFVGAAGGYAGALAVNNVLFPKLIEPMLSGDLTARGYAGVPLILSLLLLFKLQPTISGWGNTATAFLVGVGAAVAVGGAVTGTLFPQVAATSLALIPINLPPGANAAEYLVDTAVIIGGTLTALLYFYFGAVPEPGAPPSRPFYIAPLAWVGQVFITIAFGTLYAGALAASLALLSARLVFIWDIVRQFAGA